MTTSEDAYDAIVRLSTFCTSARAMHLAERACMCIAASDRVARAAARAQHATSPARIRMPRRSNKRVLDDLLDCCHDASTPALQQARDARRWLCPHQHARDADTACKRARTTVWARTPPDPLPPHHIVVHSPFACDPRSALSVYLSSDAHAHALCMDMACALLRDAGFSGYFNAVSTRAHDDSLHDEVLSVSRIVLNAALRADSIGLDPFSRLREFAPVAWARLLGAARAQLGAHCGIPVVTAHRAGAIRALLARLVPADVARVVLSMVYTDSQSPDVRAGTAFALVREMRAAGVSLAWPLPGYARLRRCLALCSSASQAFAGRLAARLTAAQGPKVTPCWSGSFDGACGGGP